MIRYLRLVILLAIAAAGMIPCRATDHVDSLLQEMLHFINPDTKLSKQERRLIQDRLNSFPQKIVRRDTTTFFLHTAYAIAYYEFSTHEYKKALKWVENFRQRTLTNNFIDGFRYPTVSCNALSSLQQKARIKTKDNPNKWSTFSLPNYDKIDFRRIPVQFLASFLGDTPYDWEMERYELALSVYREMDGGLDLITNLLSKTTRKGRTDILSLIYALWNVSEADFQETSYGAILYAPEAMKSDSIIASTNAVLSLLGYSRAAARQEIDSLITLGQPRELSPKIMKLLSSYDSNHNWKEIISCLDSKYNEYITPPARSTFHDYCGIAYMRLGYFDKALQEFDKALSFHIPNPEAESIIRLNRACDLGSLGRTEEASTVFMEEKQHLTTPFQLFSWYDNLAYVYSFSDPILALHYYNEAEKYLDPGSLYPERKVRHFCRKAQVLSNNLYLQRLAIEQALQIADEPRSIVDSKWSKGMAYTEMGAFYSATFNYAEAERYFQKAREAFGDLDKEDILFEYLDLQQGINLRKFGDYEASWNMLWQLLLREQQKYGESYKGLYKVAGEIIRMAAEDIELQYDFNFLYEAYLEQRNQYSTSLDFDDVMTDIAYHYWAKDWDKVAELIAKAMEYDLNPIDKLALWAHYDDLGRRNYFNKSYADRLIYMLPAIQQELPKSLLTLSGDERRALQKPLMQITDGMIHTWAYLQALDLVILRKGLLLSTRRSVEQHLATDKKTKQRYADLTDSRRRLNDAISFNDTTHIPTLKTEVWKKENELYHSLSEDKEVLQGILKDAKDVQKNLRWPDIALEFTTYTNDGTPSYGVFVIYAYGVKAFEDLGPQKEVEADPSIIWQRLDRHLKDARKIYFCTDGQLNTIPIEYLPYDAGRPICDVYRLHRVFHLAEISQPQYIGDNLMLIGVADHNSPIGEAEPLYRGTMTDLYNIDYELNLIREAAADRNVTCLFNDDATEASVKSISGTPVTTLHTSTHGFFRDENALTAAATDPADYDHYMARRALSAGRKDLSGLVLREGNLSWRSPVIMDENDGLLTSEEIETMSFPDLRLTVLSACESGLGATDPEGVWGLQRAFRAAGTKNLICTLSQVDDYYTAQFMDIFYQQAAAGASVYDAFHAARRWLRHEQPDRPELWSAFILIE